MNVQHLQLSKYGWRLIVFYDIHPNDLEEVIITLWEYGCPNKDLKTVALVLQNKNTGFTYTHPTGRFSIMGIGWATSEKEFINTIVHEIKHLQSDICNYYSWRHDDEQASLVAGDIAGTMYLGFKKYFDYG